MSDEMIYGTLCKAKQPTIHQQFPVTCTSSVVFRFFSARPDAIHPLYFGLSVLKKDFCHLRTTGKGVWTLEQIKICRPLFPAHRIPATSPPWGKETLGAARAKERGTREDKNWLAISTGKRTESVGNKPMLVSLFSLSRCVCRVAIDCGGPAGNQPTTDRPTSGTRME
jgi:hypothetical protein